jgi:hypothetical protein
MFQSFIQRLVSPKSQELVLRLSILSLVYLWAFSIRLVRLITSYQRSQELETDAYRLKWLSPVL